MTRKTVSGMLAVLGSAVLLEACAVTPEPVTEPETAARIEEDRADLFIVQEPLDGPITLSVAIARAIKYNIGHRLEAMRAALAADQRDLESFSMLPDLVAKAGYDVTDPAGAAGNPRRTADLTLSWNILDFGTSYFTTRQAADRILIANERKRRAIQNTVQEVRSAYARAVTAEIYGPQIDALILEARVTIAEVRAIGKAAMISPMTSLTYQKTILDALRDVEEIRDRMATAKVNLAALMNLEPGQAFELAIGKGGMTEPRPVSLSVESMEKMALSRHPDILAAVYQERIGVAEVRKEMVGMLPGIDFSVGRSVDSSLTLANAAWYHAGIGAAWNLIRLVTGPQRVDTAEAAREVTRAERLALSMAVLTQLHVALRDCDRLERKLAWTSEIENVERNLYELVTARFVEGAEDRLAALQSSVNALKAAVERHQVWAERENARSRLAATLGLDPLPENIESHRVEEIAGMVTRALASWKGIIEGGV